MTSRMKLKKQSLIIEYFLANQNQIKLFSKQYFYISCIFLLCVINSCRETNHHGFSKGINPIVMSNLESSKDCGSCHDAIYEEWKSTRHRSAFTNELYKESHKKEPLIWCVNCHAPMMKQLGNPEKVEDRVFTEEGVSCIVCHKRGDKILSAHIPDKPKEHEYIEVKEMKSSEFCANCHQFNFPVGTGNIPHKKFKFSSQSMQNTFTEWQMSYFYKKENCQNCHMELKEGYRTHNFPGGHNNNYLAKTFEVILKTVSHSDVLLTVTAKRLGHSYPTGDLFRTLVVRLLDKNNTEIKRVILRYEFGEIEANTNSTTHSVKYIRERNIITPPVSIEDAYFIKNISLTESDKKRIHFYELAIHYTNESEQLFHHVEDNTSKLVFKKERIILE